MKNAVIRKGLAALGQVPRMLVRLHAQPEDYRNDPPILANAFPKSGTQLLLQILRAVPGTRTYGSFLASTPSVTLRERSPEAHLRRIARLAPGEVAGAHLYFHPRYSTALSAKSCVHFFIIRDPRDVVVSESHYLTQMNRWHRMHRHFARRLGNEDERLSAAILGVDRTLAGCDYPNIAARFARYQGWLDQPEVYSLRYEDLIGSGREKAVRKMVAHLATRAVRRIDVAAVTEAALAGIDPRRSHTFRQGTTGAWRQAFQARHVEEMKSVAGALLVELGYETDNNWSVT